MHLDPLPEKTRLLLVDDHALMRTGIRCMLAPYTQLEVAGEAASAEEALALAATLRPHIVLMDIDLGRSAATGHDAARAILEGVPGTMIVMLSTHEEEEEVRKAIQAGAVGYLLKDIAGPELASALQGVRQGGSAFSPRVSRLLLGQLTSLLSTPSAHLPPHGSLSEKEAEVLQQLCKGLSNREIGEQLFISEKTVKSHITAILRKLGVKDRTQAALYAVQHKMVES